jgi:hypothetical protein
MTNNNNKIFAAIMAETGATLLEVHAMVNFDCETLEETQHTIAKAVTHARLLQSLMPGAIHYMKNERYIGQDVSDDFIQSEARELVADQAEMFVDWETTLDDYHNMTEAEKEAVVYGIQAA